MKIFRHGTGNGKSVINYLMLKRHQPKTIRGNPKLTEKIIDSLSFKHKYRSGVLSWEENLDEGQIEKIIDDFESFAFAGITKNNYDCLWVQHQEHDRTELHFVIPRVHLDSGLSLNPMPPNWIKPFGKWRDLQNYKNKWSSPNTDINPESAQDLQLPSHIIKKKKLGETKKDIREKVTDLINDGIENKSIFDRGSMIKFLNNNGYETPRKGSNYITIINHEDDKRVRLKGTLFNRDWTSKTRIESVINPIINVDNEIKKLELELEKIRVTREEFNINRYKNNLLLKRMI